MTLYRSTVLADVVERVEYETETAEFTEADEAAGLVRGVKLLGLRSLNRRTYDTEGVRRTAVAKLTGARIFLDHAVEGTAGSPARSYRDLFGRVESVEFREGKGWFGNIRFNPRHQVASQFVWDVRNSPTTLGFSINSRVVQGGRDKNGDTIVESLEEVRSVDIVTRPATTKGVFESEETIVSMTIEELKAKHPDLVTAIAKEAAADAVAKQGEKDSATALESLQEELKKTKAELAAVQTRQAVAEQFAAILDSHPLRPLQKEILECACQMADAAGRDSLANILRKAGPLLTDDGQDIVAEEGEKPVEKMMPGRVGGASASGGAWQRGSLAAALGRK